MDDHRQKVDVMKELMREVSLCFEKVKAYEGENRADLMTRENQKLSECTSKAGQLEKVLSEMSIQKIIEESFEDKSHREAEQNIITEESNQKSVNSYLIKKIHTLEDRLSGKLDKEQAYLKQMIKRVEQDVRS